MSRSITVSQAQDQLLETAFDLYRIARRLQRHHQSLAVPYEIASAHYTAEDVDVAPMTIELAVSEEMDIAAENLADLADKLLEASRLSDVSIRMKWNQKRREQAQQEPQQRRQEPALP